mmetsp:Transcript_27122/g.62512  ORF Transcript_27122/g.62512 Transcript_27122/m.62512 type:complete len:248 (-) Transcript_27122:702-1445(-)
MRTRRCRRGRRRPRRAPRPARPPSPPWPRGPGVPRRRPCLGAARLAHSAVRWTTSRLLEARPLPPPERRHCLPCCTRRSHRSRRLSHRPQRQPTPLLLLGGTRPPTPAAPRGALRPASPRVLGHGLCRWSSGGTRHPSPLSPVRPRRPHSGRWTRGRGRRRHWVPGRGQEASTTEPSRTRPRLLPPLGLASFLPWQPWTTTALSVHPGWEKAVGRRGARRGTAPTGAATDGAAAATPRRSRAALKES